MIEPAQFRRAAAMLISWRRPLVLTHARPDGDALGSMLAMRSVLRGLKASPLAVLFDPVPSPYRFLTERDPIPVFGRDLDAEGLGSVDAVIILDTCAYAQMTPLADWLRATSVPVLAVDHHVTRDVPGDAHLIDTSASATALIVRDWARAMKWELDSAVVTALFVGIATDTGWFAFANTDARTLEAACELVRGGVRPHELYQEIYRSERAAKVRLLGAALETLELLDDERVATMHLDRSAIQGCGAGAEDTEGIINEPMRIASVEVSVLLVESDDGLVRTSFRSKGEVDVAAVAATFGGGGHVRAAGARIAGPLAEVKRRVIERILSTGVSQ